MMNEEKNSQTQEQEEFLSGSVNVPDNHQSENASEKCGLVSVVSHASWAEGCGYTLSDCRLSLAEYTEPKPNENFYYSIAEDTREALLEHCRQYGIPTPNEIQYTPKGYYIKWNLERGYSGSEVPLWRFIQKTLHDYFAKLGSDLAVCLDATAMLYVSGFRNSDYVGFDLSERVITIYRNEEEYSSPLDFVKRLPLTIGEIESYRSIKKFSLRVKIMQNLQHTERKILWFILAQTQKKI